MRSIFALFIALILVVPLTSVAHAESGTESAEATTPKPTKTYSSEKKDTFMEHKSAMKEMKMNYKEELKKDREDFQAKKLSEKSAFKAKLQTLKDGKKKLTAERIDAKLAEVNKNKTDRMADALDKMNVFVMKLQEKITAAQTAGKDTTSAQASLAAATVAITSAQAAVTTQAGKTYTATITDESTLGSSFHTVFQQLISDLKTTYAAVAAAKKSLIASAREVAILNGEVSPTGTE